MTPSRSPVDGRVAMRSVEVNIDSLHRRDNRLRSRAAPGPPCFRPLTWLTARFPELKNLVGSYTAEGLAGSKACGLLIIAWLPSGKDSSTFNWGTGGTGLNVTVWNPVEPQTPVSPVRTVVSRGMH